MFYGKLNTLNYLPQFFFMTESGEAYAARTQKIDGEIRSFVLKIGRWNGCYERMRGGELLPQGDYIAVTSQGVFFYNEHHPTVGRRERAEDTNTGYWLEGTGPIAALFASEDEMSSSITLRLGKSPLFRARDMHWRQTTLSVIASIGDTHPCFVPSLIDALDIRKTFAA